MDKSARAALFVCFAVPLAVIAAKAPGSPLAEAAWTWCSLAAVPPAERAAVTDIFAVPVAALVVAVARLGFGVRVLSMFRPILLALAMRTVGILPALLFLAVVLGFIVLVRPIWSREPYYARVAFVLPLVALPLAFAEIGAHGAHWPWLRTLALFPIIALGLTGEGFVRVLGADGASAAATRMAATVGVALAIVALFAFVPVLELLLRYPELLAADAGLVLLLTRALALRESGALAPPAARRAMEPLT